MSTQAAPTRWNEFRQGFLAVIPIWVGVAPFGAIYAVSARAAGLDPAQTLGMSLFVFAGASQFTAAGLFAAGATPVTIIITTLVINARHILMSASLAQNLRRTPIWMRAILAAQLTDETYAVGVRRFIEGQGSAFFQFGANVSLYSVWQASTILGMFLGALIPDPAAYGLDLVFPLTFISLLAPLLRSRANITAAGVAALVSLAGALLLPGKWYIILAGLIASGIGALVESTKRPGDQLQTQPEGAEG